jgi:hypothetical protein
LIPFTFSTVESYMLEWGDHYVRFYKDGGVIVGPSGLPYEIFSPYAAGDLSKIKYCQSADVMYLACKGYAPYKLSRTGHTSWFLYPVSFNPGPIAPYGWKPDTAITLSGLDGRSCLVTAGASVFLGGDLNRQIVSKAGRGEITYVLSGTSVLMDIIDPFETTGPIPAGDWEVRGPSATALTPSAKKPVNKIITLTRSTPGGNTPTEATVISLTGSGFRWNRASRGTNEYYLTRHDGASVGIGLPDVITLDSDTITRSGSLGSLAELHWQWGHYSGDPPDTNTIYIKLSASSDLNPDTAGMIIEANYLNFNIAGVFRPSDTGAYVRINGGLCKIIQYQSPAKARAKILVTLTSANSDDAWEMDREEWTNDLGYPSSCAFFQQRLFFARNQRIWGSVTADYENFGRSPNAVGGTVLDSDSVAIEIASERVDSILWLTADQYLMVGTVGSVWKFGAQGDSVISGIITPTNTVAMRQAPYGCADIQSLLVGDTVVYVTREGGKVRELAYNLMAGKYDSPDLTVFAEHITRPYLTGMALTHSPFTTVWFTRSDGELIAFSYERDEKVLGFSRFVTDGEYESTAVITTPDKEDQIWVIVKRTIGGQDKRLVEYFAPVLFDNHPDGAGLMEKAGGLGAPSGYYSGDSKDYIGVDCSLSYSGPPVRTISGLNHLEGKTVSIQAEGGVHRDRVVSGGSVTLDYPASLVRIGLPFVSDLAPMSLEAGAEDGTSQGKMKRIHKLGVRFLNTFGAVWGPDEDHLTPVPFGAGGVPKLFTGDVIFEFMGGYDRSGSLFIRQSLPMPMTIVGIMPRVSAYEL